METNIEQEVTHDPEALQSEQAQDELPEFGDQTLDASNAFITGVEPAMCQFFYPLSLYKRKNTVANKCQLQFVKEGRVLFYRGVSKPLHGKQTTVKVQGDGNCYFHSTVYLIQGPRISTFHLGNQCATTLQIKKFSFLQSLLNMRRGMITLKDEILRKYIGQWGHNICYSATNWKRCSYFPKWLVVMAVCQWYI